MTNFLSGINFEGLRFEPVLRLFCYSHFLQPVSSAGLALLDIKASCPTGDALHVTFCLNKVTCVKVNVWCAVRCVFLCVWCVVCVVCCVFLCVWCAVFLCVWCGVLCVGCFCV